MKMLVLFSGGLDSAVAVHWALNQNHKVSCLGFEYGSKHNQQENSYAERYASKLGLDYIKINLDFIGKHFNSSLLQGGGNLPKPGEVNSSAVVPFRNGIMLAVAAGYAESIDAQGIVLANHAGEVAPDCKLTFTIPMGSAIYNGTLANIELFCPFANGPKTDIIRLGDKLHVDFANTYTCYNGGEVQCGTCRSCVPRREAFRLAGVLDPTVYVNEHYAST